MDAELTLPSLQVLFEEGIRRFPDLSFTLGVCNLGACLSIERRDLHCHPPAGLISRVRIVVREDGSFEFEVVMRLKESGSISILNSFLIYAIPSIQPVATNFALVLTQAPMKAGTCL